MRRVAMRHVRCWTTIGAPVGPPPALWPPGQATGGGDALGAVPGLGEHSEVIRGALGVAADEIATLRAVGAA